MCGDSKEAFAHRTEHSFTPMCSQEEIPDYLNDLNAMHEAEKRLAMGFDGSEWDDYEQGLWWLVNKGISFEPETLHDVGYLKNLMSATAAQRAEALLRTIGKWTATDQRKDK